MNGPLEVTRSQLGPLVPLGKGGTAKVYRTPQFSLPGFPNLVYKEYNSKTKDIAGRALGPGLNRFVRFREKLPERQQQSWDQRIVWPLLVVVDDVDGSAVGILMTLIPPRFFHDFLNRSGPPNSKPREVDTLFGDDETMRRVGLPEITVRTRLQLISGVAGAYGMMHKMGVVLGDISARNIVYDPNPVHPAVLVVDVDSARIASNRSVFSTQPHTPNWEPPEALAADLAIKRGRNWMTDEQRQTLRNTWSIQTTQTDIYKFGLMVVRILDPGRGRAVNRDPSRAADILRRQIGPPAVTMLHNSLSADARTRPSMREWYDLLQGRASRAVEPRPVEPETRKPSSGIPDNHQVGNWAWAEGTGWVRRQPRGTRRP